MESKNIEQIKELIKKTTEGKIIWIASFHDSFQFEQEIESGKVTVSIQKLQQVGWDDYYFYLTLSALKLWRFFSYAQAIASRWRK